MNLLSRMFGKRDVNTIDDYIELVNSFAFNGFGYGLANGGIQQTIGGTTTELAPNNFAGLAAHAYGANGPVFSCMLVRMLVFSSIRFEWMNYQKGKPADTFANDKQLRILQRPAVGETTQDMLVRMILNADLAGNAYITRHEDELVHMRPDWVDIVLGERLIRGGESEKGGGQIGYRKLGYIYQEGGRGSNNDPVFLNPEEVAHFHPIPDPLATYRGMSWLTPILNEIRADKAMTRHQQKFFDNGATPNMIIKYEPGTTLEKVQAWKELFEENNVGVENAYKTLHIAPGADPVPVGANLREIDFKEIRGGGETRIAAAAGVPPIIAGFSEGLESATYSNYSQARRRFADGTLHPLWENAAGSLEPVLDPPSDARLWYVAKDIPFLREDEEKAAEIQKTEAATINSLITAGFKPDSVIAAVRAGDWSLLVHTGLMSVQLLPPGTTLKPAKPAPDGVNGRDDSFIGQMAGLGADAIAELAAVTAQITNGGTPNDHDD